MNLPAGCWAVDTHILLYAQGAGEPLDARRDQARACLSRLPAERVALPVQVLGEFHWVLRRKFGLDAQAARQAVQQWLDVFQPIDTPSAAFTEALSLSSLHGLQTWDAVILAVAAQARCRVLLSEDLQHGFAWGGVTVVNPLQHPEHRLLRA